MAPGKPASAIRLRSVGPAGELLRSTIASPQTANVSFPLTLTAKDANGYTITDYEGTVNLNGWAVGSSSVTNVLLLDQSVNHYLETALSTLGLNYTLYLTDANFESALAGATRAPPWRSSTRRAQRTRLPACRASSPRAGG